MSNLLAKYGDAYMAAVIAVVAALLAVGAFVAWRRAA